MNANETLIEGSPYRIVDQDGIRRLATQGHDRASFSAMRLNDPAALLEPSLFFMLQWLALVPQPQDVVLIGLGGGQLAKWMHKHLADTRLVAVEIDPVVVDIAHRYFGLAADNERLATVVSDGAAYVQAHPGTCDVMMMDVCDSEMEFPDSLAGEGFFGDCYDAIRGDGPLMVHFFRRSEAWRAEYCNALGQFFPCIFVFSLNPEQQVIMAFKRTPEFDWAALSQRISALEPQLRIGLPAFWGAFERRARVVLGPVPDDQASPTPHVHREPEPD